ncbi:rubrerythrin [Selenomonas felix]|uniref:rubrerythrin n=1 Tax=Selenomonas felix TaxID=1944634 RepID=UPI000C833F2F|nr:rubrerythrin family protein [Selenomonas felix]
MELKGSQTEKNLWAAFAGESQAHTKYLYYASQAQKDGYQQISDIFNETARNEKAHAKIWFKLVHGVGDTKANLADAAAGEHGEWTSMYPEFARVAREEGFDKIARLFDAVGKIEKEHDERYKILLSNVEEGKVFRRDEKIIWQCLNCGYVCESPQAPAKCPVCEHPQSFFQQLVRNY